MPNRHFWDTLILRILVPNLEVPMRKTLLLITTAMLSACAYATDTSVQKITIRTPGAEDAKCLMYVDGVRYRMHPPETTTIATGKEDLIIDCMAPGNRRKEMVVEPMLSDKAVGNVATAGVGLAWDYASGALYKYPDVVEVSSIGMEPGPALIPAQNNPDIRQPEEYMLEEFSPSQPRMNSDRNEIPTQFLKRGETSTTSAVSSDTEAFTENPNASMGKGELQNVIESYSGDLNPGASEGPTPIIPGE